MISVNIYDYHNYRTFLSDWFKEQKKTTKGFSLRAFASKAGLSCHSFCSAVVKGRRNLTKAAIEKMVKGLGLDKKQSRYFPALVCFNQAKSIHEKLKYKNELQQEIRSIGKGMSKPYRLIEDQYQFFSKWYHSVVYTLIDMQSFRDEFAVLAQTVDPPITVKQAQESAALLERLSLVYKDDNGIYKICNSSLTTDDQTKMLALSQYYIAGTSLARRAIEQLPSDERNISGVVVGVSPECYKRMVERVNAFRRELVQMAVEDDMPANRVYQLALYLFPVSKEYKA